MKYKVEEGLNTEDINKALENSKLHQNRIIFAVVKERLKISDTNQSHKDWLNTLGINKETNHNFEFIPRGYILKTSDTLYHVVSYIGEEFSEYELSEETKRQLEVFIKIHHGTPENIMIMWYTGVKIGRIGETWKPLHHVDTTYPKDFSRSYLTEIEKLKYENILHNLTKENMGEKVIDCVRNELNRVNKM